MTQSNEGKEVRHIATGVEATVTSDDGYGKWSVELETGITVLTEAPEWQEKR